jgi:hypothetical protein
MYRPVKVSKRLNDVFGSSSTGVAHGAPTFLHDVVCLSYLSVPDGTAIRLGALVEIVPASVGASLCIYAQDEDDSGPDVPHTTGINDLLSGSAGRPDLNLSRVGEADGAPEPAFETAVDRCELRNLIELRNDISRTGRTGCTGCFLI